MNECACGCGEKVAKRFVRGHHWKVRPVDLDTYVVEERGYDTPCWVWQGKLNRGGYAQCYVRGRYPVAHRLVYQRDVGPIPEGLQLDHLCRVRACVNPAHLDPVTCQENVRRGHLARNAAC